MSLIIDEYINAQKEWENKYGKNTIILMMVGSFYEIYEINSEEMQIGHAKDASIILNIQLTKKNKSYSHSKSNPYMAGFPCYALGKHLSKLLRNNFTVAIYNQFDIKNSKKKERKLINIYSPSTYIEEEILEYNELMCILIDNYFCPIEKRNLYSGFISIIDLSTGKNKLYEFYDTKNSPNLVFNEIDKLINAINPCEILFITDDKNTIKKNINTENILTHYQNVENKYKDNVFITNFLEKIFGKKDFVNIIEYLGLERNGDLLTSYVSLLQFAYQHDPYIVKKLEKPKIIQNDHNLIINNDALNQLNLITQQNYKTKFNSLFTVIDNTSTRMGKRLLKDRLLNPITDIKILNKRYDDIENMKNIYKESQSYLKHISDLEKIYRKLILKKLHPYEFSNLEDSLLNITKLLKLYSPHYNNISKWEDFIHDYYNTFDLEAMKQYNINNISNSFFKTGIIDEIDQIYDKMNKIEKFIDEIKIQLSYLIENNKNNLVKYEKTEKDGFYFYITKKRWQQINKDSAFTINYNNKKFNIQITDFDYKINTNNVKLTSNLTHKITRKYENLSNNIKVLVKEHYFQKLSEYEDKFGILINQIVKKISEIDVITSNTITSIKYCYSRPIIKKEKNSYLNIIELRHPILERIHDDKEYITNDIYLRQNGILLYGLNSSGKSSLLRSIGCNIILAQMGMYVSAKNFIYSPFKYLLTKISTIDNLFKGQSTFIVEMNELKNILEKSSPNSLILCDELTAGTETDSATGIVTSAIISLLKKQTNFIFTTHLHSIVQFPEIKENDKLKICHFQVKIEKEKIIYNRKIKDGSGDNLYGIEIAKAMGLDSNFIQNAFKFRSQYQGDNTDFISNKRSKYNSNVIIDQCDICGEKNNLHTHHIQPQKLSDSNGIIKHFPKNIKHNLQIVCQKCHIKIHKE